MTTHTKQDLAEKVSLAIGLDKTNSKKAVDAVFEAIASALSAGDEVNIHAFGKFKMAHRKARKGVNPSTGEQIQIAACSVATFKISSTFKEALNTKKKGKK